MVGIEVNLTNTLTIYESVDAKPYLAVRKALIRRYKPALGERVMFVYEPHRGFTGPLMAF